MPLRTLFPVLIGGAVGTLLRAGLSGLLPAASGAWPWTTFWINLTGSFSLGLLLELLFDRWPDSGWRHSVRLGVGTGMLGGFTTYSTFAVETVQLAGAGGVWLGVGYAAASVTFGLLAAGAGLWVGRALVGRRSA